MEELIKAAEYMLSALPEGIHEKYGGYRFGCTCPRCRLVLAVSKVKGQPPPAYLQSIPLTDEQVLNHVSKYAPYSANEDPMDVWIKRVLLAFRLGMIV